MKNTATMQKEPCRHPCQNTTYTQRKMRHGVAVGITSHNSGRLSGVLRRREASNFDPSLSQSQRCIVRKLVLFNYHETNGADVDILTLLTNINVVLGAGFDPSGVVLLS